MDRIGRTKSPGVSQPQRYNGYSGSMNIPCPACGRTIDVRLLGGEAAAQGEMPMRLGGQARGRSPRGRQRFASAGVRVSRRGRCRRYDRACPRRGHARFGCARCGCAASSGHRANAGASPLGRSPARDSNGRRVPRFRGPGEPTRAVSRALATLRQPSVHAVGHRVSDVQARVLPELREAGPERHGVPDVLQPLHRGRRLLCVLRRLQSL